MTTIYRIRPVAPQSPYWSVWRSVYSDLGGEISRQPVLTGVSLEVALKQLTNFRWSEARKESRAS